MSSREESIKLIFVLEHKSEIHSTALDANAKNTVVSALWLESQHVPHTSPQMEAKTQNITKRSVFTLI